MIPCLLPRSSCIQGIPPLEYPKLTWMLYVTHWAFFNQCREKMRCHGPIHTIKMNCPSARRTRKINLPTNRKGYEDSETTIGRLSAKENPDLPGTLFCYHFLASFFLKQAKTWSKQNFTRQNRIRLVKYSSAKVSDPSEVPRFVVKSLFSYLRELS